MLALLCLCLQRNLSLKAYYVPGLINSVADYLSRFNLAQQTVSAHVFRWVAHACTPTIDRFATAADAQLAVFNSFLPCANAGGVDAFAQGDWCRHVNWCHLPPMLVGKLLQFLAQHFPNAAVVLYAPWWPAAPWSAELAPKATWHLRIPAAA